MSKLNPQLQNVLEGALIDSVSDDLQFILKPLRNRALTGVKFDKFARLHKRKRLIELHKDLKRITRLTKETIKDL